jgi:hypothetical protein
VPQGDAARAGDQAVSVACSCEHCGHEFESEPEGGHRLLCGDSTESDAVNRLMHGERAALVATDPPYLVDYKGGDHPFASTDSAARRAIKNKDWSETYHNPPSRRARAPARESARKIKGRGRPTRSSAGRSIG